MDKILFKRASKKVRGDLSQKGFTGFDMHFHTKYSMDGLSLIPNVLKTAAKKGIGVAITDHNQIKGVTACIRNRKKVPIIPGIEVTCKKGTHILLYFYTHDEIRQFYTKEIMPRLKPNPFVTTLSVPELIAISKDYNCINSAAHPFAPGALGLGHMQPSKGLLQQINNIEVVNGYCTRQMNKKSLDWAYEYDRGHTAGSDGHSTSELGKTLIFVEGSNTEDVLSAIKKGNTRIVGKEENLMKKLILTVDKSGAYIKRSRKNHQAKLLLKTHFGNEFRYIKDKIKNRRSRKMKHFRARHL